MKRPTKLISKLRNGCDLSVKEEFDVYWYIHCLEKNLEKTEMKLEEIAEQYCHWYQKDFQECETWQTSCGDKLFNVINGTPKENGMLFCPYCGKNIIEHDYNEQFAKEEEECDAIMDLIQMSSAIWNDVVENEKDVVEECKRITGIDIRKQVE